MLFFRGGFNNVYSLLINLIHKIRTPFLLVLFSLCSFSAIVSSFSSALHAFITLIIRNGMEKFEAYADEQLKMKAARWIAIFLGFISFLLSLLFKPSLLQHLFFFGYIYAALIIPIVIIIFSKQKVGNFIPITPFIAMIVGYISSKYADEFLGIWISFLVSMLLTFFYLLKEILIRKAQAPW